MSKEDTLFIDQVIIDTLANAVRLRPTAVKGGGVSIRVCAHVANQKGLSVTWTTGTDDHRGRLACGGCIAKVVAFKEACDLCGEALAEDGHELLPFFIPKDRIAGLYAVCGPCADQYPVEITCEAEDIMGASKLKVG